MALQARFPRAEAWGQASSRGGDVSATPAPSPAGVTDQRGPQGSGSHHSPAAQRPPWAKKPNSQVVGLEWAQ